MPIFLCIYTLNHIITQWNISEKSLTMKVFGDGTGLAFIVCRPLTRVTVPVATHAGELVVVQVGPRWAVRVTGHATQQCVWIQHQSLLALRALVCVWAGAAHTSLVALCTQSNKSGCCHINVIWLYLQRGCDHHHVLVVNGYYPK